MKRYLCLNIPISDEMENYSNHLVEAIENAVYKSWYYQKSIKNNWHTVIIEVVEYKDDYFDSIAQYSELVDSLKDELGKYLSPQANMSLQIGYEYDDQCNLEFLPEQLACLSSRNIVLTISCWKTDLT